MTVGLFSSFPPTLSAFYPCRYTPEPEGQRLKVGLDNMAEKLSDFFFPFQFSSDFFSFQFSDNQFIRPSIFRFIRGRVTEAAVQAETARPPSHQTPPPALPDKW